MNELPITSRHATLADLQKALRVKFLQLIEQKASEVKNK